MVFTRPMFENGKYIQRGTQTYFVIAISKIPGIYNAAPPIYILVITAISQRFTVVPWDHGVYLYKWKHMYI